MKRDTLVLLFILVIQTILVWINQSNFLFWDTIQFAGKHPNHFYANGLDQGLLFPLDLDSGHPPSFGIFLCSVWKLFGKTLELTHWVMWPFLIGIHISLFRLSEYLLIKPKWTLNALAMCCPFYLGHSILVSPDIPLLFGFLLCLFGILKQKKWCITIGALLMAVLSLRGMSLLLPLVLYYSKIHGFSMKRLLANWKSYLAFFPAVLIASTFLMYHLNAKGWVVGNDDSPWASSFELIEPKELFKNIFSFYHRLVDHGMFLVYGLVIWKLRFLFILRSRLIWLLIFVVVLLALMIVPFSGLLNHRYFLPAHFVALLLAGQLLSTLKKPLITSLIMIGLFLGNFLVYPEKISQGWDSTYAHQPVYGLMSQMEQFIDKHDIRKAEICTAFPFRSKEQDMYLNDSADRMEDFHSSECRYVLYSNINNDFSDTEIDKIKSCKIVHQVANRQIQISLYNYAEVKTR